MGPLLFLFFINDLPSTIISQLLEFADDTKCFQQIISILDIQQLQEDLNSLFNWTTIICHLTRTRFRLESIMLQNFPIMLFGISPIFFQLFLFLCFSEMHYAFILCFFFMCRNILHVNGEVSCDPEFIGILEQGSGGMSISYTHFNV